LGDVVHQSGEHSDLPASTTFVDIAVEKGVITGKAADGDEAFSVLPRKKS